MQDGVMSAEELRKEAVKKYTKQFMSRFKSADKVTKEAAKTLVERAAFMAATLDELQEDISRNGAVIVATNGNGFEIKQENPAQKSYNAMIKNYNSTIVALNNLAKETGAANTTDLFIDYITGGAKGKK